MKQQSEMTVALMAALAWVLLWSAGSVASASEAGAASVYPMHRLVPLPESKGWKLRVNTVRRNATALIRSANVYNKPPASGRQFFLINVTMAFAGKGKSTAFQAGRLGALGRANRAYSFKDTCGIVPNELDEYRKVTSGQTVTGNICFSVRRADARALVLVYEPLFSATNTRLLFALR